AALTGALSFKHAKPGLIRDLIAERTDPVLFGLSYDYVGDLSETVALMWPKTASSSNISSQAHHPPPQRSPTSGEGQGGGYRERDADDSTQSLHGHNKPPPPT